ncbi:MAG: hypothetical protein PARBA_01998 [Parabacteroides sp.]
MTTNLSNFWSALHFLLFCIFAEKNSFLYPKGVKNRMLLEESCKIGCIFIFLYFM